MIRKTIRRAAVVLLAAAGMAALTASAAPAQTGAPGTGPGGPVLVVTAPGDPFGTYYAEILRAEGLNEFAVANVGQLSAALLARYHVVLLAPADLSGTQAGAVAGWVNAGGNLVAMRPGNQLAGLLGLGAIAGEVDESYLKIDTSTAPGAGLTGETMQVHGGSDIRSLAGARQVAGLYSDATTPAGSPAVTVRSVGPAGGQAAAFMYDLARSVVLTRQGNPAQAGQRNDGQGGPIRPDNLFMPGWLDFAKIRIPQADEQQRLLANLVIQMNLDRMPLPRFWYLPRGEQATVVMTGDDHRTGGTVGQFDSFRAASPADCSVANWECVRGTSYVYPGTPLAGAAAFQAEGFEIALHLETGCEDFTPASLAANWATQLPQFESSYPGLAAPRTNRTHCVAWSDWAGEAKAALANGVRLDTNYYYWPAGWVMDRPGLFTGSGFPMRFADDDGSLIDVYQAATQITDESGQTIPTHIRALIDGALGPQGYYGVFTANMHTDLANHPGANAIVAEAVSRGVPVVSAAQMLDWLDGRNDSSFANLSFTGNQLRFSVRRGGAGARGLQAMLPLRAPSGPLTSLTRDGVAVSTSARAVKGMGYAFFDAADGAYVATYGSAVLATPTTPPPATPTTPPPAAVPPGDSGGDSSGDPRVSTRPQRVRVGRDGVVRIRVKCPADERRCRVRLQLRLDGKVVASRTLVVKGGKTRVFRLELRRAARRELARTGSVRVTAVAVSRDSSGDRTVTRRKIRLVAR